VTANNLNNDMLCYVKVDNSLVKNNQNR